MTDTITEIENSTDLPSRQNVSHFGKAALTNIGSFKSKKLRRYIRPPSGEVSNRTVKWSLDDEGRSKGFFTIFLTP